MDGNGPNVKVVFAGVQMTLIAIVLLLLDQTIDTLSGAALLLAAVGTIAVSLGIKW